MEEIPGRGYSLLSLPVSLCKSCRLFRSVCLSQAHRVEHVELTSPFTHLPQCGKSFFFFFPQEDLLSGFLLVSLLTLFCFHLPVCQCLSDTFSSSSLSVSLRCWCLYTWKHSHIPLLSCHLSSTLNTSYWIGASLSVPECHHLFKQVLWENNQASPCIRICMHPTDIKNKTKHTVLCAHFQLDKRCTDTESSRKRTQQVIQPSETYILRASQKC